MLSHFRLKYSRDSRVLSHFRLKYSMHSLGLSILFRLNYSRDSRVSSHSRSTLPGTPGYSVVSGWCIPGTREYSVISGWNTPGTREYSIIWGRRTPESFYSSPPNTLFFNEIAGFKTKSRSYLLKYGVSLDTPTSYIVRPLHTRTYMDTLFLVASFLLSSSHETFVK